MRAAAMAICVAACASASAGPVIGGANTLWRRDVTHLAADRALVRACLEGGKDCVGVVQAGCIGDPDMVSAAQERLCDWRAMAAWEDEMLATLTALRAGLSTRDRRNLETSQRAWEVSMLADVGLGMDAYEGGSLAGPMGAHIRARATAQREIYLEDMRSSLLDARTMFDDGAGR